MLPRFLATTLLLFIFLATNALTQPAPPTPSSGEQLITMDFQDVEIGVLVKFISEITGRNFILDEKVRGKITVISPSKITIEEAYRVFQSILDTLQSDNIRLVFRKSEKIGANAFALPDGTILFTDDLVVLAENNEEIVSIMLHEIGHLHHRHSLRMAIQGFSLAIFITMVTGDVSASSSIVTSLPAVLIESGYSRDMESEADTYSLLYMLRHNIDPIHFANIMRKLEASHNRVFIRCRDEGKTIQDCLGESMEVNQKTETDDESLGGYFSSHPGTDARIRRFEDAAANASEGADSR